MNRLSDSIIYCVHSKPNGFETARLADQNVFRKVAAEHRLPLAQFQLGIFDIWFSKIHKRPNIMAAIEISAA